MSQDRRQPLGGISKETFVNAQDEKHYRELQYDIMSCIDSKIQFNSRQIVKINNKCPGDCIVDFDKRYIQRIHEKIPLSLYELIAYCVVFGGVALFAYLYHDKIIVPSLPIF